MAAVETPDDVEEQIIDPLKILMKGINPDEIEVPFSSNMLKFMINNGVWELAHQSRLSRSPSITLSTATSF